MTSATVRRIGTTTTLAGLVIIGSAGVSHADVGRDQAGQIVTGQYGGEVISVESDSEAGEATWEVEVSNSSQGRIEVDVSQASGNIVAVEAEDDDDDDGDDTTDAQDSSDPGDDGTVSGDDNQVGQTPSGGVELVALGGAALLVRRRFAL